MKIKKLKNYLKIENYDLKILLVCLAIPKQITSVKKGLAAIKLPGGKRQNLASLIKVKKGDWVLTQNNVIIKKISAKQAAEINKLLK